jgi:hypothetical protein
LPSSAFIAAKHNLVRWILYQENKGDFFLIFATKLQKMPKFYWTRKTLGIVVSNPSLKSGILESFDFRTRVARFFLTHYAKTGENVPNYNNNT